MIQGFWLLLEGISDRVVHPKNSVLLVLTSISKLKGIMEVNSKKEL